MRLFAGLIIIAIFLGWALYRLLIRKDLFQHKVHLQAGLFFCGTWALIYWYFLS